MPHYPLMLTLAIRFLGDADAAADAIQDVAETLWMKRQMLENYRSAQALCVSAVRNRCISILRHEKLLHGNDITTLYNTPEMTAENRTDSGILYNELMQQVRDLNEPARTVMLLSIQGFNTAEIVELTGLSTSNVRQIIYRSRCKLRDLFSKN